jgi:hypothetical protein
MKIIKTYTNFINELKSFDHREGKDQFAMWSNGDLVVNPTNDDRLKLGFRNAIYMEIQQDKKTIKITPFDDWADTKIALRVQQALKDMIKSKIIDETWNCIIMQEKTMKRSLGSKKVKDIIKMDYSYVDVIPFAYHGTSDYFLSQIESKGLMPREESGEDEIWDKGYTNRSQENVYMTTDYARARYYADYAVDSLKDNKDIKSKPIIVQVQNLPTSSIVMDDDLITNMGMLQMLAFLNSGKSKEEFARGASYITGIRQSGQFAVMGRIPASMITKIYKGREL